MTQTLLILTVGTGIVGQHSDLASGLRTTVELLQPDLFWLVPSTAQDSLATADLVAENQPAFAGQFPLKHPDSLEHCRQHLRTVIQTVREQLQQGDTLLVNPTSGTKQMTAAATLAALDEGIGNIVFTTGERVDGVVKTGTEKITDFNPADFFRERDLTLARDFFKAGDFSAAERVLRPHKNILTTAYNTAFTCHHWRRFDYERAKTHARQRLANRTPRDIIADHLAWAQHALAHNDPDAAIRLTYKALELTARLTLEEQTGLKPDARGLYKAEAITALRTHFVPDRNRTNVSLGLQSIVQILAGLDHPFGTGWEGRLSTLSTIRNEATHHIRPADKKEAEEYLNLATIHIGIKPTHLPTSLEAGL